MNVTSRRFANAVVLHIDGRLDQDTCGDFTRELMVHVDSMAHGGGAVILDLAGLEYISSAGLRCFMLASRQAKQHQMKIYVAGLQAMVREIFEISHFNLIFQVFPTVREALATISPDAAVAFDKG